MLVIKMSENQLNMRIASKLVIFQQYLSSFIRYNQPSNTNKEMEASQQQKLQFLQIEDLEKKSISQLFSLYEEQTKRPQKQNSSSENSQSQFSHQEKNIVQRKMIIKLSSVMNLIINKRYKNEPYQLKEDQKKKIQKYNPKKNYQIYTKKHPKSQLILEQKLIYYSYVNQRHQQILNKIKELNSFKLIRLETIREIKSILKISSDELNKSDKQIQFTQQLQVEMEKCLILPFFNPQSYNSSQSQNIIKSEDEAHRLFFSNLEKPIQRKFMIQIAQCLSQLHKNKIQHLDVKIGNIVYSLRDNRFKLIDFDMSRDRKRQELNQKQKQKCHTHIEAFYQEETIQEYIESHEKITQNQNKYKMFTSQEFQFSLFKNNKNKFYEQMKEHCGKIDSFKFGFLLLKLICELKIDEKNGTIIQSSLNVNQYHLPYLKQILQLTIKSFDKRSNCSKLLSQLLKYQKYFQHFFQEQQHKLIRPNLIIINNENKSLKFLLFKKNLQNRIEIYQHDDNKIPPDFAVYQSFDEGYQFLKDLKSQQKSYEYNSQKNIIKIRYQGNNRIKYLTYPLVKVHENVYGNQQYKWWLRLYKNKFQVQVAYFD